MFDIHIIPGTRCIDEADDLDASIVDPPNGRAADDRTFDAADADDEGQLAPVEWVAAALACLPNDGSAPQPWDDWAGENGWSVIAMAVFRATEGSEDGFDAFDAWSSQHPTYKHVKRPPVATGADRTRRRWEEVRKSPPDDIGWVKLRWLAEQYDEDFDPVEHRGTIVLGAPWDTAAGAESTEADDAAAGADTGSGSTAAPGAAVDPRDIAVYDLATDTALVPPRPWISYFSFCRELVSMLTGPSGAGKSAVRILYMLAVATGDSELTGEFIWRPGRALFVSFEEDLDEIRRRVRAAVKFYKIDPKTIEGSLLYASLGSEETDDKLMEVDKRGKVRAGPLLARLRKICRRHRPDVVNLDPMVDTHSVPENDNTAQNIVIKRYAKFAREEGIALDLTDHDRKGAAEAGDQERNRGASSKVAGARLTWTLTVMSEKEAKRFGIDADERRRFVRYDSAKVNPCPPQKARWFELVDVALGNGDDERPGGDRVQVAKLWQPPPPLDGTTDDLLEQIIATIDAGLPDGRLYSDANGAKAPRAAWLVVQQNFPDKTKEQCASIIRDLMNNGRLIQDKYYDKKRCADVPGLRKAPDGTL